MIFETHAHYDDEAFDKDREELLNKIKESGIGVIVNVASDKESCETTLRLAKKYPFIYAALGVHPSGTAALSEKDLLKIEGSCSRQSVKNGGRVVAVGEIGLDYYWDEPARQTQKIWFEKQMEMAKRVKLPMVIHSRDAARDTLDMMKAMDAGKMGGIIHCYAYSREIAGEFLDMGFSFGIGGVVTFKNALKLKEVVSFLPMENIVLETDSPYLAPVPERGKRNSSLNLPLIAEKIAEIKGLTLEETIKITEENARRLFSVKE